MTSVLQILFFVLGGFVYALALCIVWLGIFPEDSLSQLASQWTVLLPAFTIVGPFFAFILFTIGYDPRTAWAKSLRGALLSVIQPVRSLSIAVGCLAVVIAIQSLFLKRLFVSPDSECLALLLDGDVDNAAAMAKTKGLENESAHIVWLVSQSEIEAKRRSSTSDNPTEVEALRQELPAYDQPFTPLWTRFLANYGLGKLAFCRKDIEAIQSSFERASKLARWIDDSMPSKCSRAAAQAYFALSLEPQDPKEASSLVKKAQSILHRDTAIQSQRLLGSIIYKEGDFGGAFRIWKAVLDRSDDARERDLEIPDAIERKRLLNNMALARLQQGQPNESLKLVENGLAEPWDRESEDDRTEQVRLMATHALSLLVMGRPTEALQVFEERTKASKQMSDEGLTAGSLLLKANILAALWKNMEGHDPKRVRVAKEILECLLLAQDPDRLPTHFNDHSSTAYKGLVANVTTLWRWTGISFDKDGCESAILSLLQAKLGPERKVE